MARRAALTAADLGFGVVPDADAEATKPRRRPSKRPPPVTPERTEQARLARFYAAQMRARAPLTAVARLSENRHRAMRRKCFMALLQGRHPLINAAGDLG